MNTNTKNIIYWSILILVVLVIGNGIYQYSHEEKINNIPLGNSPGSLNKSVLNYSHPDENNFTNNVIVNSQGTTIERKK